MPPSWVEKEHTPHRKVTIVGGFSPANLKNMFVKLDHLTQGLKIENDWKPPPTVGDWPKTQQKRTGDLKGYSGENK